MRKKQIQSLEIVFILIIEFICTSLISLQCRQLLFTVMYSSVVSPFLHSVWVHFILLFLTHTHTHVYMEWREDTNEVKNIKRAGNNT